MPSQWTIGWRIPTLIAALYLVALGVAVVHIVFFLYLHDRPVDSTVPQAYVSTISTALVTAFRSALVGSLGLAFTQRIWRLFRKRPLKASTIDLLYTVLHNPLNLLSIDILRSAKLEFLFALLCWCIPIATTFPPGAIGVVSKLSPDNVLSNASVFTFDPTFLEPTGSNTTRGNFLRDQALFVLGADGEYRLPSPVITRLVKQSILGGNYLVAPSPCGLNCSYSISFPGPAFKCESRPESTILFTKKELYGSQGQYIASEKNTSQGRQHPDALRVSYTGESMGFELSWTNGITKPGKVPDNPETIYCDSFKANYTMDVTYLNGVQNTTVQYKREHALNGTLLSTPSLFYTNESDFFRTIDADDGSFEKGERPLLAPTFLDCQLRAIRDAVVYTLVGSVADPYVEGMVINNTMILDTDFAVKTGKDTGLQVSMKPGDLEELLQNATLSVISLGRWNTTTAVMRQEWENVYTFHKQNQIYLPYGVSLAMSFIFVMIGALALVKNGVAAEGSSFLQAVSTTTGNETLAAAAAAGCLGGAENRTKDLLDMKLVYGELKDKDVSEGLYEPVRTAGFGPPDEIRPLRKGGLYGI